MSYKTKEQPREGMNEGQVNRENGHMADGMIEETGITTQNSLACTHAHAREDLEPPPDHRFKSLARWQQIIIEELRKIPNVTLACLAANRTSTTSAYKHREENEVFRELWDEALMGHTDCVEQALHDVAVNGHEKVHYGKDGEVKSVEKVRDVNAMKFWLQGNRPKTYRETHGPLVNINLTQVDDALSSALNSGVLKEFFDRKLTEKGS